MSLKSLRDRDRNFVIIEFFTITMRMAGNSSHSTSSHSMGWQEEPSNVSWWRLRLIFRMKGLHTSPHDHINEGSLAAFLCPCKQCRQRRVYCQILPCNVIPFVQQQPHDGSYYFWSYYASGHYSRQALEVLQENGIRHIRKGKNRLTVASWRPI